MARGTAEEIETTKGATSSRLATGTMTIFGDCVATAVPAVEQIGQMWEADGVVVRSEQKWNCAPRKMMPRSSAKVRTCRVLPSIYMLGSSLRRNGCGVKHDSARRVAFLASVLDLIHP